MDHSSYSAQSTSKPTAPRLLKKTKHKYNQSNYSSSIMQFKRNGTKTIFSIGIALRVTFSLCWAQKLAYLLKMLTQTLDRPFTLLSSNYVKAFNKLWGKFHCRTMKFHYVWLILAPQSAIKHSRWRCLSLCSWGLAVSLLFVYSSRIVLPLRNILNFVLQEVLKISKLSF